MVDKIYCLFATCSKAMEQCGHAEYTVMTEKLTLQQAKEKYPNSKFCEDWELGKRKWQLVKVGSIDERSLRVILKRLCDMAVIPDNYDADLIIDTFEDGKLVKVVI